MPIIVFNSTHQALAAEKALEDEGLAIEIVPLPADLAADCGLAIEFNMESEKEVKNIFLEHRIKYKGIYIT